MHWNRKSTLLNFSQTGALPISGHSEIVKFAQDCEAETVVVYHTDPSHARPPLVEELESNGHTVHTPLNGESTIID